MIRLLITGGRHFADRELVFATLDRIHAERTIALLIHGACGWNADDQRTWKRPIEGADGLADAWANARCIDLHREPAHWTTQGRAAGPRRNEVMIAECRPDVVVAFSGGRGTADCVRRATLAGIEVLAAPLDVLAEAHVSTLEATS